MGNMCPCPKRNQKKNFAYDVHEQTFEMEDNIHNIGQNSPKNEIQDNNILTEDLRVTYEPSEKHHLRNNQNEVLPILHNQNNSTQPQCLKSQNNSSDTLPQNNNVSTINLCLKEENQIPPLQSQYQLAVQPPKPTFHPNILKPKTQKKKYNPDDYRFINENECFKVKKIDSIKEQQFNIENCTNCQYFIFDITANLYIDDCVGCLIFVAPCQSTIFVRNCKNMTLIAATKQFRTFQCHNSTFSLYCKSQPVIESSSELQFTSFQSPVYPQLFNQFHTKKFEPWNNHWSEIHNFTKKVGQTHFTLSQYLNIEIDWKKAFQEAELEMIAQQNPIPLIKGDLPYQSKKQIIIDVNKDLSNKQVIQFLKGSIILRAFQGIVIGQGKQQKRLLLIDSLQWMEQKFEQIGRVVSGGQVKENKGKYFISFSDQREK